MSEAAKATAHKARRQRSPSYPGIGLEAAIERARVLHQKEGRNTAPNDAILHDWGYGPKSGPGLVTIAALKRFGLLVTEGAGRARLSNLGLSIILGERDSPERDEAIKQAALMPGIHREIWDKYKGHLPSDATIGVFLRLDKGFTDGAADELIRQFRDTVSFAELSESDELSDGYQDDGQREESEDDGGVTAATATRESQRGRQDSRIDTPVAIRFPVVGGATVTLNATASLTEAAWDQMMAVLGTMKAGVVSATAADDASGRTTGAPAPDGA